MSLGIQPTQDENFTLKFDDLNDPTVAAEKLISAASDLRDKKLDSVLAANENVKTILAAGLQNYGHGSKGIYEGLPVLRNTKDSFLPINGLNALLTDPIDQGNGFSIRTHKVSGRVFVFCSNAPHRILSCSFDTMPQFSRGKNDTYTITGKSQGRETSVTTSPPGIMIRNVVTQLNNPLALLTSTGSEVLRKGDLKSKLSACFGVEHGNSVVDFAKLEPNMDLSEAVQRLWPIKKIVGGGRFQLRGNDDEVHIFDTTHGIMLGEPVKKVEQVARHKNNGWAALVVTNKGAHRWVDLRDGRFVEVSDKDYTVVE